VGARDERTPERAPENPVHHFDRDQTKARRAYPVSLLLSDKLCVVIGAGEVAARKVEGLLDAGARVRVVAPAIGAVIPQLRDGRVECVRADYDASQLEGARVVIAATDSREVNERVSREARERGCLVNVVDDPELCDFIVPAITRRGELSIAVQTGGASPALARNLRRKIESVLPERVGEFVEAVGRLRSEVMREISDEGRRREVLEFLASDEAMAVFCQEGLTTLRGRVREQCNEV